MMVVNILENGMIIKLKELELIKCLMAANIKANGLQICSKESVFILGMMEDFIWENLKLTKGTDMEY